MATTDDRRRQVLYWRLISSIFDLNERHPSFDRMALGIAKDVGMPESILDPNISIDTLVQRFPALRSAFEAPLPIQRTPDDEGGEAPADPSAAREAVFGAGGEGRLRATLVYSKLLLNAFG